MPETEIPPVLRGDIYLQIHFTHRNAVARFFNDEIIFDKPTHSYRCQSCATRRRAYPTFSSTVHGVYSRPEEIVEATPAVNVQRLKQWIDDFFEEEND